jgi:hypothetical protein
MRENTQVDSLPFSSYSIHTTFIMPSSIPTFVTTGLWAVEMVVV